MSVLLVLRDADMFVAVVFFGAFGVIEAIQGADQIAGDAANPLERRPVGFGAAAFRARAVDDAVIPADRIAVHRMVDRAVADAVFLHAADDGFKGRRIFGRVAVQLDVSDVAGVRQRVIRRFQSDFFLSADRKIDRNME